MITTLQAKEALIFGINPYALELLEVIEGFFEQITLYIAEKSDSVKLAERFETIQVRHFSLDDDWQQLADNHTLHDAMLFAMLDDDAQNIFLTISLRASFASLHIVGYANSQSAFKKLQLAQATHVISNIGSMVDLLCDTIMNPYISKLRLGIYLKKESIDMHECLVSDSPFIGKTLHELALFDVHNLIVLAARGVDDRHVVRFSNAAQSYCLQDNDVLIYLGSDEDAKALEERIKESHG